jgi:signal transduction histidine kinase
MNLVKNAVEANADKIELIISANKKYWNIIVKDNGTGISEKVKNRIFDPFFTTKKEGSGIGLTFVVKAVYQLNGNIFFASKKIAEGTTFVLRFEKINTENS